MDNWWNRLVTRVRGQMGWESPTLGANGTVALLAEPHLAETAAPRRRESHAEHGAWTWVKSRLSLQRPSARAQLLDAVVKLAHACEVIEHHLERQQACMDEISLAVHRLSTDLASLPSATLDQKRQMERLCETVSTHRNESAQLGALLADVPATLRRTTEALDEHGVHLRSHGDALSHLADHSLQVQRTHEDIRTCVTQLGQSQQEHAGVIEAFVSERRKLEHDLNETITRTSRRLTAMVGVAIALATVSSAFGVIQLFLRLTH